MPVGDAVVDVPGLSEPTAAVSTFANAFAMNWLVIAPSSSSWSPVASTPRSGVSGNAPGGDEANARFIARFGAGCATL